MLSNLQRILGGGLITGLGVLGMHYSGMLAQRAQVEMRWTWWVILLSAAIATITASAAFWIIFRVVSCCKRYMSGFALPRHFY